MPAPKMYTKAQWDEFVRLLDALPEKPPSERRITVRDAMPTVRIHIDSARAKGYSVEQLIEEAKQVGIDVTTSALRYALQETKKRRGTRTSTGWHIRRPRAREYLPQPIGKARNWPANQSRTTAQDGARRQ